jgi:hypothetical protein
MLLALGLGAGSEDEPKGSVSLPNIAEATRKAKIGKNHAGCKGL